MSSFLIDGEILLDNPKAVIFDKDGTLIDINHYWVSMIKLRASFICLQWFKNDERDKIERNLIDIMGVNLETGKMKPDGPIGIRPRPFIVDIIADFIRKNGHNISNNEIEKLFKKVDQYSSKDMSPFLKILPGVEQLLIKLNKCDIDSIIASTDTTSRAQLAMKTLKLDHYFTKIIGGDLVKKPKPAPDMVNLALECVNCDSDRVIVIGDHPFDILMGESANSGLNLGVLTGLSNSTMFDNLNCVVIDDLTKIDLEH